MSAYRSIKEECYGDLTSCFVLMEASRHHYNTVSLLITRLGTGTATRVYWKVIQHYARSYHLCLKFLQCTVEAQRPAGWRYVAHSLKDTVWEDGIGWEMFN